ncbi:hypothetical protein [Halalkalibacterium ligniniphilum]|uniref:hypothetical protein n=1 Tax=Halalkalibacterium ligniniphilum TaxID=1134413 RepID=UPI0003480ACB
MITGLGSTFVGSFLIAATTSLPEAVSVFVAKRLRNFNLAIGAIEVFFRQVLSKAP